MNNKSRSVWVRMNSDIYSWWCMIVKKDEIANKKTSNLRNIDFFVETHRSEIDGMITNQLRHSPT